eukprot:2251707-Ditylum_brightwellii.AAC.1
MRKFPFSQCAYHSTGTIGFPVLCVVLRASTDSEEMYKSTQPTSIGSSTCSLVGFLCNHERLLSLNMAIHSATNGMPPTETVQPSATSNKYDRHPVIPPVDNE